jgi:hypothetical protein
MVDGFEKVISVSIGKWGLPMESTKTMNRKSIESSLIKKRLIRWDESLFVFLSIHSQPYHH